MEKLQILGFTSRKFLLAVSAAAGFAAARDYGKVLLVVLGYLGVEGVADIKSR